MTASRGWRRSWSSERRDAGGPRRRLGRSGPGPQHLYLADDGSPVTAAVLLFSPWVDLALTGASLADPATRDPVFPSPTALMDAAAAYLAGADPRDGRASPLHGRPATLPPPAIQVGTDELLLDDARRYAERFAREGGAVRLDIFEGLHHVFQRSVAELQAARDALDSAAVFIMRQWRPAASGSE